jgi:putative tryptophan/tyrosine transport system substrate-binding protein
MIKRREVITLLGGAAVAWPLAARGQQPVTPIIGYLSGFPSSAFPQLLAAFREGLNAAGYVEGRNVAVEYRWAEGQYDRLPALAADLVRRQVAVIAATGVTAAGVAAKAATPVIPIVFATGGDPVKLGLVASLNRPGGNVTGISWLSNTMAPKRLELLRELLPQARTIGFLVNPGNPNTPSETADVQAAADALGLQMHIGKASSEGEIDAAFAAFVRARVDALFVAGDPFFTIRRVQLVILAARHAVPICTDTRMNVEAGGVMSYGASTTDMYRGVGLYTGRILKGEKPADLPVQQSVKFELVINLKTAKTLGLDIPAKLLALADEVIE